MSQYGQQIDDIHNRYRARFAGFPRITRDAEEMGNILAYMRHCVRKFRLEDHILTGENVVKVNWLEKEGDKDKVALADSPEAIMLLVTGGPGKHSLLITNFGNTAHASRRIGFAQTCDC